MDQALYAIGKQIQWNSPELLGEDKYVVMMGHIEMAGLKMLGDLVEGSGRCEALAQANVAVDGSADTSHVGKTRRAHQVTAATLHILQRRAYIDSHVSDTSDQTTEIVVTQ